MVQCGPVTNADVFKIAGDMGISDVANFGLPMTFYNCDATSRAVGNAGGSRNNFWSGGASPWGWDMDVNYNRWLAGRGTVTVTCNFYLVASWYSFEGISGWAEGSIGVLENNAWRWASWKLENAGSNRARTVDVSITLDTSVASALKICGRSRICKFFRCRNMVKRVKDFL